MKNKFFLLLFGLIFTQLLQAQSHEPSEPQVVVTDTSTVYSDHKKHALKIAPFTFLIGYTSFAYEQSLKAGRSLELKLGIIGLGVRTSTEGQFGATATIGYKFINEPTEPPKRNRYRHVLRGAYFRPDFTVAVYKEKYTHKFYEPNVALPTLKPESMTMSYACIVPTIGSQKVWHNGFVTDFYVGAGLAAVFPISGKGIVDFARYGNRIRLDKTKGDKIGFPWALKMGLLLGGVF